MQTSSLDIPIKAPNALAGMVQTHARVEITPNGDDTLRYDMALPKDWAIAQAFGPVPEGLFQERGLGIFAPAFEPESPRVAVTLCVIPFELPVDAWVRCTLEREGWEIVRGQWFPGPNGLFYDVTGTRKLDDLELVRRTSARADGSRIVCVNSQCGRTLWDGVKEDFWTAHVTFALLGGVGNSQMEPWVEAKTVHPDFETVHPASWFSEPAESANDETSGLHIRLTDDEREVLLAYLLVRAEHSPESELAPLTQLLDETLVMLEKSGLEQAGGPQRLSNEADPRCLGIEGWLGGYAGAGRLGDAEMTYRIGFIARKGVVFTLVLYSPKLEDDLLVALRALRAFEIVRGGLQLVAS